MLPVLKSKPSPRELPPGRFPVIAKQSSLPVFHSHVLLFEESARRSRARTMARSLLRKKETSQSPARSGEDSTLWRRPRAAM